MSKPLLNRDAYGERSSMARYDFMIKESKFVKKEQIEIREKEKQEVLKILRQLKLLCLKPLGKDDYIKDGISIKWYVDKLQNYFCRQWVVKKDNNAAKKGELIRPYNKLKKHYPSYVNMERILELLLEHLNKNKMTPENLRKLNMKKGSDITSSLPCNEPFLIKTDDPEVFIQIKACSWKKMWEYKNVETNKNSDNRPFYYFYVKLLKISQEIKVKNQGQKSKIKIKKPKYLTVGASYSRKIKIESRRCYWGFNRDHGGPFWIEDMDDEEWDKYIEDFSLPFSLPEKLEDTDTLRIHLTFGNDSLNHESNENQWYYMDIVGEKTIQPIKNNNIERLKNNCYHWLGDESITRFNDIYNNIHGFGCTNWPYNITEKEKIHNIHSLKSNILGFLDFYLPDENGEVEALCFKSKFRKEN